MPSFLLTSAVPGDCESLFSSSSVQSFCILCIRKSIKNIKIHTLKSSNAPKKWTWVHLIHSFHAFNSNGKYFLLQHPRQCVCDLCPDHFRGVLATPPHQIHLQRLLLLGDQIFLHQCAQDDHGERDRCQRNNCKSVLERCFCQQIDRLTRWPLLLLSFQSELPYATWQEVQARIVEIQKEHQICIHKKELTELDIYHRILRFKNYMVPC